MKKDINYYLSLNYPIEITKISDEEGGGYSACIPLLGRSSFISDGETIDEAINNLQEFKEESFVRMIENGVPISEPIQEDEEEYSGKFLVRIPIELHRAVVQKAKKNNISLNQYLQYIITIGIAVSSFEDVVESYCIKFEKVLSEIKEVEFNFERKIMHGEYREQNLHIVAGGLDKQFEDYSLAG